MTDREQIIQGLQNISDEAYGRWVHCQTTNDELILGIGRYMDDAIRMLKDPTPWISVNDRLPEKRKAVLAYAPRYNNIWAVVLKDNGWHIWAPVGSKYDPDWDGPITHWMPLPKPPEECVE